MAAPMTNVSEMSSDKKFRIEVTVVTGFEDLAREEAEEKLDTTVFQKQGRISFDISIENVAKILELGFANHCMVVMKHIDDFEFTDNEHENLNRMRKLAGDLDWPSGLKVWSEFFSFEHPIKDIPDVIPTDFGEVTVLNKLPQRTETKSQKRKRKMKMLKSKFRRKETQKNEIKVDSPNDADKAEEYSKDSEEGIKDIDNDIENLEEKETHTSDKESFDVSNQSKTLLNAENDGTNDMVTSTANVLEDKVESDLKIQPEKQRTRLNPWNPLMPSFRVTCNRSGEGHNFSSMAAAANLGGGIYNYFGWNVKMTEMDIEVIMNISNQEVTVGIALTREALHKGNIKEFGMTTLRPSICYGLLRLCEIQPGDIVCDPMCGVGSLPIQGATRWPQSFHLGADIVGNAMKRCKANMDFVNQQEMEKNKFTLPTDSLRWNACNMPLRNQSVDVFVSDLPFGIRIGAKRDNWKLYCESLSEMARCSKPLQTRACLLTEDKNCMIKTLQKVAKYWSRVKTLTINIGGLSAGVYLLQRTGTAFEQKKEEEKKA